MPTKRRRTNRVLSADAQKANMEQWAVRVGLPKEIAQEMLEKYGPYAYKIMKEAMQGPTDLMRKAGQRPKSSKNAIKFFAESEIDTAQLAKVVGENELKVQNKLADYQITTASMPEPVTTETQTKAAGEVSHLDARVDEHEAEKVELTEKQKRDMNTWARQVGLNKADMNKMIVKYGVTAYDIVHDAMYKPSVVMRNMDEKPVSSKKTIQYFLNNDVSTEKVAKALGKSVEDVESSRINAPEMSDEDLQPTAYIEPTPPTISIPSSLVGEMSTAPAQNVKDFQTQAYDNFAKSEAKRADIYLDCNGHPTTGVGHIILNLNDIGSPQRMQGWRARFLETCDYPNMTKEEQGKFFDKLSEEMKKAKNYQKVHHCDLNRALQQTSLGAQDVKGAGWDLTAAWVQKAKLPEKSIRKAFNSDFDYWYKQTKNKLPQLDNYPLPMQLSVLHTAFAGKLDSISTAECKRDRCKLMEKVSRIRNPQRVPRAEGDTINIARQSIGLQPIASRSTPRKSRSTRRLRSGRG